MPGRLLAFFSLLFSTFTLFAQPKQATINGKSYFVFPFNAGAPNADPLEGRAHFRENWSGEKPVIEPFEYESDFYVLDFEGPVFEKAAREFPWLWYSFWNYEPQTPPPALDSLPDGDYVRYYHGLPYLDGDTIKYRFGAIHSFFSLKKNVAEGKVVVFAAHGDTIQTGSFKNGLRDGEWKLYDYRYEPFPDKLSKKWQERWFEDTKAKRTCSLVKEVTAHYENGKENGVYNEKKFSPFDPGRLEEETRMTYKNERGNGAYEKFRRGSLVEKGTLLNGLQVGEWWYYCLKDSSDYHMNPETQLIRHYVVPEERKKGQGVIIRDVFYESTNDTVWNGFQRGLKTYSYAKNPMTTQWNFSFGYFYEIPNADSVVSSNTGMGVLLPDALETNQINNYYQQKRLTRTRAIDSLGYCFKFSFYEEYYPNGQLIMRFKVTDGQLEKEDTVFWNNGQAANVVNFLPQTGGYEEKMFDRKGKLVKHDLFDSKGYFLETKVDETGVKPRSIHVDGVDLVLWNGAYSYQLAGKNSYSRFTVLNESRSLADTSLIERSTYDPATRKFVHERHEGPISKRVEGTVSEDSLTFTWTSTCTFGDFSSRIDSTISVGANKSDFSRDVMLLSYGASSIYGTLLYKGKPYSGKARLQIRKGEASYKIKGKDVEFYIDHKAVYLPGFRELTGGAFMSGEVWNPPAAGEKYNVSKIEGQLVDGRCSGEWLSYYATGKLLSRMFYSSDGVYLKSEIYAYAFPESYFEENDNFFKDRIVEFPTKPTWHLSSINNRTGKYFSHSESFDWTGQRTYLYDMETGEMFSIEGNMETSTTRMGDSTITVKRQMRSDGTYKLYNRTATLTKPTHQAKAGELNWSTPILQRLQADMTEQDYDTSGVLVLCTKTDSIGRLIFQESYASNGDLLDKATWSNGWAVSFEQWSNGILQQRYTFRETDSIGYQNLNELRNQRSRSQNKQDIYYSYGGYMTVKKAHLSTFDPQGTLRQEGDLRTMEKTGLWNYYDAKGRLVRKMDYTRRHLVLDSASLSVLSDSLIPMPERTIYQDMLMSSVVRSGIDSIVLTDRIAFDVAGRIQLFDTLGNKVAEGNILEWTQQYQCTSEDYYENFIYSLDAATKPELKNGWTSVVDENGIVKAEGNLKDGLPEGFWKFYNADRTIREAGVFHKGKRNGRWLSGDLSKVNYLGDLCLGKTSESELQKLQQELDLTVLYYTMGTMTSHHYYNVNLGK